MKILSQKSREGCQLIVQGNPCHQDIEGRGAWKFCPIHGVVAKRERAKKDSAKFRFLAPFGDMTFWNILASCVVLPYRSLYLCVTTLRLGGHLLSVAPETSSMEGGDRFHLDTSYHRPCPLVT